MGAGSGYIVVFDDISDVISAQRSVAWGEVARRLAHEIKNPLTPIQLSAERLQMKLESRLSPADAELLNRSTSTIVNQVDAMKRMVDDFRDYAKAPPAVLLPLDLNALIGEILDLYLAGDDSDIIHAALAPKLPAVMGDATQLRQVIHNLLQNAQDAMTERAGRRARRRASTSPPRRSTTRTPRAGRAPRCAWRSSTTAPVSRRASCRARSNPTSRRRRAAPAWACRWSKKSSTNTAGGSTSRTGRTELARRS